MTKSKPRYRMGYDDGSGSDDTIYDVKLKKPVAVVSWGCSCCKTAQPGDTERGQLIVDALNAYKPKGKTWPKQRKTSAKRKSK
jgi:hypothetical protein